MHMVIVCGTNRKGSLSRLLVEEVRLIYAELGHSVDVIEMIDLPTDALSPTAYKEPSESVQALVNRFLKSDGAIFVVPEYNGSYPGVLKLFVDMLPYPEGFDSRPCAFIGLAAGQFKSLRAVEHFQQVAGYRHAHLFHRRMFIGDSFKQFVDGKLSDNELTQRLREQAEGFTRYATRVREQDE